ncbi:hypothetical protein ACO2Q0_17230 [Phenylobacterium sp. VNQ135]|uniref:terminase small subunit-like protein n=1 Tax=Phenylobacterium sp. VNQ135 TaxID=3400922 RepID=UPI003C0DF0BC
MRLCAQGRPASLSEDIAIMDTNLPARAPEQARTRAYVRYAKALIDGLLKRIAQGESLAAICREPGMPSRNTVMRWARERPTIRRAIDRARAAAGQFGTGGRSTYCPVTAQEIFRRVSEGESLSSVCRDPAMPAMSTVTLWRQRRPDFDDAMLLARETQAERLCDTGWDMALGADPETAYVTEVRLRQLRWMTAMMAPRRFGRFKAQEAPGRPEMPAVGIKVFRLETRRSDGWMRMVTFAPDPETNQPERVDEGPWKSPLPGVEADWEVEG